MSLRLQLHHSQLFGFNFIPVIGCDDPMIRKIIRFYHLVSCPEFQTPHRNSKSTVHSISKGQFGVTWATKKKDVETFINLCGKCNRFKVTKRYNPMMGHSLIRVYRSYTPFSHVSLDPLGHLYCSTSSRTRMKIFPLIVQDINTGVIFFEMMTGLSSKDIFLALQRIQFKYCTNITQIFTDAGTQMEGLGKETDY